ncbi:hypothetical protein MC378_14225 [Polaribacter sp. MSW13]|uniref:Uncharacterized protein n=1 Tax=Polaribacter marinus TaxID=2916838 RepID=A0A9X1VSR1_9FLAO|nr:hypothetical protein [Polaribacter marinus]MCI2230332.1 hypothetical protein [Polaribacter marinus]
MNRLQDSINSVSDTISKVASNKVNVPIETDTSQFDLIFWISVLGGFFSLAGAIISLYTFAKVKSIEKAKSEEREVLTGALNLKDLAGKLRITESYIRNEGQVNVDQVQNSLTKLNAELTTAMRILLPEAKDEGILENAKIIAENYWTNQFALDAINKVQSEFTVLAWRVTRVGKEELLQKYINKLHKNPSLKIKILFISPDAPGHVYVSLEKMLTTNDAKTIRKQQIFNKELIISTLRSYVSEKKYNTNLLDRIELYEMDEFPYLHAVVVDEKVYYGINFYMSPRLGATELLDRSCIEAPISSPFGEKVIEQIKIVQKLSRRIPLNPINSLEDTKETPKINT